MTSNEIRSRFLTFFADRGHRVVPSSSLVPANDPTLLFTNAGMNQFKDVFLGREKRDYTRACSVQKCVRAGGKHNDLEQVGRTTRHDTFFEMLGNFSFGDYFKKEAIPWAWELVTKGFLIPTEKLYVTVFEQSEVSPGQVVQGDHESLMFWSNRDVPLPPDRIRLLGAQTNFWFMGHEGPCGPCSEIHYDMGPEASDFGHKDCAFPCDCGRYVELWNLVFMEFNRVCDNPAPHDLTSCETFHLERLPTKSVDTGAGLERLAAALQGKTSNFDTDLFRPLIEEAANLANVEYGANRESDISLRIIADHARAATFLISDGVLPSNEGRGYTLRLIVRRALYHGQRLGLNEPFLHKMPGHVVDMMKGAYPELAEAAHHVAKVIRIEEERYARTTSMALQKLEDALLGVTSDGKLIPVRHRIQHHEDERKPQSRAEDLEKLEDILVVTSDGKAMPFQNWKQHRQAYGGRIPDADESPFMQYLYKSERTRPPQGTSWVPGDEVFKLHDTFGLRPDFVEDIVKNYGLTIDREGYEAEMRKQQERARASWKGTAKKAALPIYQDLAEKAKTDYDPYRYPRLDACQVVALVVNGRGVDQVTPVREPKPVEIVLNKTPFYAEAGGQIGDTGRLIDFGTQEEIASVTDTFSPVSGLVVHKAVVRRALRNGDFATAVVDTERRNAIRRNHTATHLLHAALRSILGTHVKQAGSLVAPDRLRFDFTHYAALDPQDLVDIEDLVNEHVLQNEEMHTEVTNLDAAIASGAMALFGEKYGAKVRVVSVADGSFSKELCGGTHVSRTGDIGLFKIVSESSVAAGTRRIEALTGEGVLKQLREASETLALLSNRLRAKPGELLQAAEKLTESEKKLRKELASAQTKLATAEWGNRESMNPPEHVRMIKGVNLYVRRMEGRDREVLRKTIDILRKKPKMNSGVIVLGCEIDGKVALIASVSKDLTNRLDAGKIVKEAAAIVEGTGGGRKDLAEAGGKSPEKLDESLKAVPSIVERML